MKELLDSESKIIKDLKIELVVPYNFGSRVKSGNSFVYEIDKQFFILSKIDDQIIMRNGNKRTFFKLNPDDNKITNEHISDDANVKFIIFKFGNDEPAYIYFKTKQSNNDSEEYSIVRLYLVDKEGIFDSNFKINNKYTVKDFEKDSKFQVKV